MIQDLFNRVDMEQITSFPILLRSVTVLEGSNVGVEGGEDENGIELSLTLSIGGNHAKPMEQKAFIHPEGPLAKREAQALRRREARKKRGEKLKKSFSTEVNGYNGGYVKSNFLDGNVEEKNLQGKVRKRGEEEGGGVGVEPARKREKNENCFSGEEIRGLSLSLNLDTSSSVPAVPFSRGIVYPCVMPFWAKVAGNEGKGEKNAVEPAGCRSFRPHEGKRDSKESGGNLKPVTGGSYGCASAAVSDNYRSSSTKGGSCISDVGSNSSHSQPGSSLHKLNSSAASNTAQSGHSDSFDPPMKSNDATNKASTIPHTSPTKPTQDPPKSDITRPIPTTHNHGTLSLTQMPYVSTTGNGPNGKTIAGFLYRYTKTEVSIVCVCHGTSFSPAEFVAHAGGVDIEYPLRHITVVSSPAFG